MSQTLLPLTAAHLRELHHHQPARFPLLLDSASAGSLAGWTLLGIASGPALWLDRDSGLQQRSMPVALRSGFLDSLAAWWRAEQTPSLPAPWYAPWRPGWAVYLGYEVAAEIEPRLRLPSSPERCQAFALRTPAALACETLTGRCWGLAAADDSPDWQALVGEAEAIKAAVRSSAAADFDSTAAALHEPPAEPFIAAVRAAREHIAAGDIYQANLSRRWRLSLPSAIDGRALYERLRIANPAPFAARAQFLDLDLCSSSPERLLRITDGEISTRPIAGTRPRSGDASADLAEIAGLIENPKERAEHIMLIDLERNDLGRVCAAGSVEVNEWMAVESYAHVHHIVSNVRGRLRADATPVDALRALFPGGTITGVPKLRCMEIIAALETEGRGAYTGSLGWLGCDGNADLNILIRTLSIQGNTVSWRAGAGIVADSVPERELDETRAKARGLLRALGYSS